MTPQLDLNSFPLRVFPVIQGEDVRRAGADVQTRENPARPSEPVTQAEQATVAEARAACAAARAAFDGDVSGWVGNARLREQVLRRTAALLRDHAKELARVVSLEVGMPLRQAQPHVQAAADVFDFYAGYATKVYGETLFLPNGSLVALVKEPVGVVGMVLPWNFPLTQAARKLAPAFAAGCTAVVKPAVYTAASTFALVRMLQAAGAPPGVINFVAGPGAQVGQELVDNPQVDKLSFTGSTENGVRIGERAARTMKRVSLELGGKNPMLVFADADLDAAAAGMVFGNFRNAGQACGATSRLLVEESVAEPLLQRITALLGSLRLGDPLSLETDLGPLISRGQRDAVLGFISEARGQAHLRCGGTAGAGDGYFVAPTVFMDVDPQSRLWREEVFGPVLAARSFHAEDEALRLANDSPFGLTASVYTTDSARGLRMARRLQAGTVWLGDAYTQPVEGIWGGFKHSGIGRELGPHGLLDFVEVKQVYLDGIGGSSRPHYAQVLPPQR